MNHPVETRILYKLKHTVSILEGTIKEYSPSNKHILIDNPQMSDVYNSPKSKIWFDINDVEIIEVLNPTHKHSCKCGKCKPTQVILG
jgi:hypothetical protein